MEPKTIRWLHISDLHMGCRGREVWWRAQNELRKSIDENCKHFQPIDMILVTGDLTFEARSEQFDMFDSFLEELLGWLRQGQAADPTIIPVPGNHDLVRPTRAALRNYRVLENFWTNPEHEDVSFFRNELWQDRNASIFDPLFGNYVKWMEKSILPRLGRRVLRSHFPGDLTVLVDLPGRAPLTVVGLNSAWIQYNEGNFDRKIELFTQQLDFALGGGDSGSSLDILDGRRNFLLMHHPPDWLSRKAEQRFNEDIYPADRFLLCLHGHMHGARSTAISRSGGGFRYFFQAPSLFGIEDYGTPNEHRAIGYVLGSMNEAGIVRVWPFKLERQSGKQVFLWDREFKEEPAGACEESIRIVRREDGKEKETFIVGYQLRPIRDVQAALVATVNIVPWLEALLQRTAYIEISGIGAGFGQIKGASRYQIEELYTPLRSQSLAGRSSMADLMSHHHLLLIEGQPGAGKTTFLHMVATMLARDLLGIICPDGRSWREKYLRIDSRAKKRAPLFLRLSGLATLLAEPMNREGGDSDDRRRLLDLLARTSNAANNEEWRKHWEGLLVRGEAILLLDGLDEVADDRLRERIFAIFRDACRYWDKCPVIVTSRPFGAEAVQNIGFHRAVIQNFGKEEIREFIERWVAALHNLPIGERPEGAAGEKSDLIIRDVLRRPAIRQLATNPMMLTCLCVVHWNEGALPEGRARLYRAVIRWLIAARMPQRERAGFTDRFAFEAFAALAMTMMGGAEGAKATVANLEDGAEAVRALVERHFPREISTFSIRKARDWLRFECLWSGIVEEPTAGKVSFRHLTFQEYLAAQELAWRRDGDDGAENWWPVVRRRLDDLQWRETMDLLPGVLFDEGGSRRVDSLLERVIELRGVDQQASLATNARFFGIVGRILGPMIVLSYKPPPEIERLYQELRDRILPMFGRDGAAKVLVKTRIEAAEALGQTGDPRLDDDSFIEVPGTGGVSLGRYPVTVQEYHAFIDAGGYQEPKYWLEDGWRLRGERGWSEPDQWYQQLDHPNWPVTGISWYEARAYCEWRSSNSDWTFRLPKEEEWQTAATSDGRTYPWGDQEPDPDRANFGFNVGSASPVGVYPAGDGAYGHSDFAGNVWEWMDDLWDRTEDRPPQAVKGICSSSDRVNRGGSWNYSPRYLRSANRYRYVPDDRSNCLGFRITRTLD